MLPRTALAIATGTLALAIPAAGNGAVVSFGYGGATAKTPIVGSDQHLPPLSVTTDYLVSPAMGANIVALRQSGGYTADINGTVSRARTYLDSWLDRTCGKKASVAKVRKCKAMVVSDMDDTLVSWYQYYADPAVNWTENPPVQDQIMQACGTPAIQPSVNLLRRAKARGVAIVVISGRKQAQAPYTASCLETIGVTGVRQIILRSPQAEALTAAVYKSRARAGLEKKGWKIALSLGDQVSDMSLGHADAGFLLPNPMYFIP